MSNDRTPSKSPARRASLISALSAKIGKVLGDVDENHSTRRSDFDDRSSVNTKTEMVEEGQDIAVQRPQNERSVSRGRDKLHSSGRGGAGNIRRKDTAEELSSPVVVGREPDLSSPVRRGREGSSEGEKSPSQAVGRGGIGNIRSRSRARAASRVPEGNTELTAFILTDAANTNAEYERNVIQNSQDSAKIQKSGRGGIGNITKASKSRSRSGSINVHSTGRGGAGNLQPGSPIDAENAELLEEFERLRLEHEHEDGIHSTGRGGLANMTRAQSPPPEGHPHYSAYYESLGRGGAGNIVRSRSASRDPEGRARSSSKVAKLWNKMSRSRSRDVREEDDASFDRSSADSTTTTIAGHPIQE
ncbi:unnamed protein product [Somion occarium]|uniref:Uncharacterized protein n=1 Tax=Somion occarium TaxID=3059160 RepID=A0ABP1DR09_9APHY